MHLVLHACSSLSVPFPFLADVDRVCTQHKYTSEGRGDWTACGEDFEKTVGTRSARDRALRRVGDLFQDASGFSDLSVQSLFVPRSMNTQARLINHSSSFTRILET